MEATTALRRTHCAQAILDSGATGHYGSSEGVMIQTATKSDKVVGMANGAPVAASVTATLPYPGLPAQA
jgi:hypothetical protein